MYILCSSYFGCFGRCCLRWSLVDFRTQSACQTHLSWSCCVPRVAVGLEWVRQLVFDLISERRRGTCLCSCVLIHSSRPADCRSLGSLLLEPYLGKAHWSRCARQWWDLRKQGGLSPRDPATTLACRCACLAPGPLSRICSSQQREIVLTHGHSTRVCLSFERMRSAGCPFDSSGQGKHSGRFDFDYSVIFQDEIVPLHLYSLCWPAAGLEHPGHLCLIAVTLYFRLLKNLNRPLDLRFVIHLLPD